VDQEQAANLEKKLKKGGKGFDLEDFREQLQQIKKMGGLGNILEKMPGGAKMGAQAGQLDDDATKHMEAIISSMTPWERRHPDSIKANRKRRIAQGSGTSVQEVNRLLKQFAQMQKAMKQMKKKGGMKQLMGQMGMGGDQGFPM
jgi:signal recognition particle subunit SRP54